MFDGFDADAELPPISGGDVMGIVLLVIAG